MPFRAPLKILFLKPSEEEGGALTRMLEDLCRPRKQHALAFHRGYVGALEAAQEGEFNVVVLRLYDDLTGCVAALEAFREDAMAPPVIVVSDTYEERVDHACMTAGASDYLVLGELTASLLERFLRQTVARATANQDRRLAVDLRDRILTVLAHDIRGPLSILQDGLGYYHDRFDYHPPKKIRHFLQQGKVQTGEMLHLLNQLLEWARSQTKDLRPRQQRVALDEIMEDLLASIGALAQEKFVGVDLQQKDPPIPVVWSDENMLRAILRNLLGNALKFSPQGSTIIVVIKHLATEGAVEVRISDHGAGIPVEEQQRLLHGESVTVRQGTNREKGTGFGFLLCMHFARLVRAQLSLESDEGVGTTVVLTVPVGSSGAESLGHRDERLEGVRR